MGLDVRTLRDETPGCAGSVCGVLRVFEMLGASSTANAGFLLDNGSDGASDGWAVSGVNEPFGGFTQFQQFTVPDVEGWLVSTIGIDGYTTQDPMGSGLIATVLPDVSGVPDEGSPFGSAVYFLTNDPFGGIDWRDEVFDILLPQGTYWLRAEANDADYNGTWRSALMGGPAFSRRNSDGAEFSHEPLSLRIQGVVPTPGALGLLVLGLGTTRRRRRH